MCHCQRISALAKALSLQYFTLNASKQMGLAEEYLHCSLRKCRALSHHRPKRSEKTTLVNGMEIFTDVQRLRFKINFLMGKKFERSQLCWFPCTTVCVCIEKDSCYTIFTMHASLGLADSLFVHLNSILSIRIS